MTEKPLNLKLTTIKTPTQLLIEHIFIEKPQTLYIMNKTFMIKLVPSWQRGLYRKVLPCKFFYKRASDNWYLVEVFVPKLRHNRNGRHRDRHHYNPDKYTRHASPRFHVGNSQYGRAWHRRMGARTKIIVTFTVWREAKLNWKKKSITGHEDVFSYLILSSSLAWQNSLSVLFSARPHFLFLPFAVFLGSLVWQDSLSGEILSSVGPQFLGFFGVCSLVCWDAWSSGVLLWGLSSLPHMFLYQNCARTPPSGVAVVIWCLLHRWYHNTACFVDCSPSHTHFK